MIVLLLLFSLGTALAQDNQITDANSRIGYGFFLPEHDMLGLFTGGAKILDGLSGRCIVTVPHHKSRRDTSYFMDTQSFFSSVSTRTGVTGQLKGKYTMGATFNSKSSAIASSDYQASGATLFMHAYLKDEVLSGECLNTLPLDSGMKAAFEALPVQVDNPHYRSSWSEYEIFLQTHGSHLVSTTHFGAYIEQYNFAKSEKQYSQTQFEARVCGDFLGPTKYGDLNVTACFGMDYNQIKASTHLEMSSQFVVLGGNHEARTALLLDRSNENIVTFLNSANDKSAVGYKFTGIWDLLQSRYVSTEHHAKALNLEYYYKGFLDTGCGYLKDSRTKFELRKFIQAEDHTTRRPSYRCHIPPRGCNTNSDCHIGGAGAVCYCYGNSCIDHKTQTIASETYTEAYVKSSQSGSYNSGVNVSCYYAVPVQCHCNYSWDGGMKTLWSSEDVNKKKK